MAIYKSSYSSELKTTSEKTEELLEKIYNILSTTDDHFSISASWESIYEPHNGKDTSQHTINFNPAIYLPSDKYKVALKEFSNLLFNAEHNQIGKNSNLRYFNGVESINIRNEVL
jgi:hypothetical protein